MSGLKPRHPDLAVSQPIDPGCLTTREVPSLCLRFRSHRQRVAIPYALLLRLELAEDETACLIAFATYDVRIRGRFLRHVYDAVSLGQAALVSVENAASVTAGTSFEGPLVTEIRIEPTDESGRARR